jgi:CheY-like chemotaxis protein
MGIPAYVVASSLVAVLAQRLVRKLCSCKTTQPDGTAVPKGCEQCRFSGFGGRMGVYELMRVTPRVRSVLLARATDDMVRRAAQATGMKSMFQDGLAKAAQGMTVAEEIRRVIPPDDVESGDEPEIADPAAVPAPLSEEVRSPRPTRILVVDDDPALREILRDTLEGERYEVAEAGDGNEALAHVYRERPDLIVADLKMPVMDGLDLLKKLRRDLATCQIPVIVLTGVEDHDAEAKALDLGADDYLNKPPERGRLLSRIRRSLLRAHLRGAGS